MVEEYELNQLKMKFWNLVWYAEKYMNINCISCYDKRYIKHKGFPLETDPSQTIERPLGDRLLTILGYEHLRGLETKYVYEEGELAGQPILTENIDVLCGPHIAGIVTFLENTPQTDPKYHQYLTAAQSAYQAYFPEGFEQQS